MRTLATAEDPPFNRAQDYRHIINERVRSCWVEELIVMQPNGLGRFIEVQKLITIVLGGAAKPYIGLRGARAGGGPHHAEAPSDQGSGRRLHLHIIGFTYVGQHRQHRERTRAGQALHQSMA